jgi:hypothetical protein
MKIIGTAANCFGKIAHLELDINRLLVPLLSIIDINEK